MRLFFWVALIALLSSTMGFASTIPASTVTVASPITVADTVVADSDVVNTATLDYNGGFSYNTKIKIKVVDAVTGKRVALADFAIFDADSNGWVYSNTIHRGIVRLRRLPFGTYDVLVNAIGYHSATARFELHRGDKSAIVVVALEPLEAPPTLFSRLGQPIELLPLQSVILADFGNMRVMNAGMVSIACIPGTVCLPEQANLLVQKGFNAQIVVATVGTPASVFGSTITVQQINPATGSVSLVVKKTIVK